MMDIRKRASLFWVVLYFLAIVSFAEAQTFPQDLDYSYFSNTLVDAGYLWQINSTFHPYACQPLDSNQTNYSNSGAFSWMYRYLNDYTNIVDRQRHKSNDGLRVIFILGLGIAGQTGAASNYNHVAVHPFVLTVACFDKNWYARLYIRATNEVESLPHYSGVKRKISRAGFNTGEIDQSVIGYQNKWTTVEYGRSREIWGPFADDNLLLAGNSPAYERLMLQFNYHRFTCRWFYGFLETVSSPDDVNINRYLVGRVLEYNNKRTLVISVGEISVLAGPNRPADWAFLNPIALHLEVEQNSRENNAVDNRSNSILFLNADWLPIPTLRLTGSFILDDFQLEKADRDQGAPDPVGGSIRLAWTPIRKPAGLTFVGSYVRIGTYTMPHSYGYANLVNRGEMIGHPIGNDADDVALGVRLVFSQLSLFELKIGKRRWGDSSMLYDPYKGYVGASRGPFPSGDVETNRYLALKVISNPMENFSITIEGHIDLKHSGKDSALEAWTFSARYQIPFLIADN
ncbi:MAG: hypothetical protein P9X24_15875 [Candidatus Hatepunaea meridiana]|nr:hypothetical protein [Candidatus Hatepunaea meridiana]